jgi:endonuclease/exonuclease/phosphatase family metal-dependent hydrolase
VLVRGWVWARTTIGGRSYTFATAHTEANLAGAPAGLLEQIRAAQVGEMVATLGSDERIVLMGDLNDTPGSPMYTVLVSAGFADIWADLRQGETGNTCCHLADLSDPVTNFSQRIDYVFARGVQRKAGNLSGEIEGFGVAGRDRLAGPAYPIWPSDHAGLVAELDVRGRR